MRPVDTTPRGQRAALSFEFELSHPPEKVWRALTDPALVSEWLLPVVGLGVQPGTAFTFQAPPQPGWDGTVRCRILEADAHRTLRYTWVVGDMEIDTVVTFTLTPTPSGTRLSLQQSGFRPDQAQAFGGARFGWKVMGERLFDLLARSAELTSAATPRDREGA
jgi:uncharacterized protein YndB with AHSA1/START domain